MAPVGRKASGSDELAGVESCSRVSGTTKMRGKCHLTSVLPFLCAPTRASLFSPPDSDDATQVNSSPFVPSLFPSSGTIPADLGNLCRPGAGSSLEALISYPSGHHCSGHSCITPAKGTGPSHCAKVTCEQMGLRFTGGL